MNETKLIVFTRNYVQVRFRTLSRQELKWTLLNRNKRLKLRNLKKKFEKIPMKYDEKYNFILMYFLTGMHEAFLLGNTIQCALHSCETLNHVVFMMHIVILFYHNKKRTRRNIIFSFCLHWVSIMISGSFIFLVILHNLMKQALRLGWWSQLALKMRKWVCLLPLYTLSTHVLILTKME